MIDFIEGKITVRESDIFSISHEELALLATKGLIEKRHDNIGTYYYLENETNGMRFAVFVGTREEKVNWIRLSWLDSPVKCWKDVSDKAMIDEHRLLLNVIENEIGKLPDSKSTRKNTWSLKWGQLEVRYEPRSYQADIFMKPQ